MAGTYRFSDKVLRNADILATWMIAVVAVASLVAAA